MIPNALGIDDGDWAAHANTQAIRFAAEHDFFTTTGQAELLQAFFQEIPCRAAGNGIAAIGHGWLCAEKNVSFGFAEFQGFHAFFELAIHARIVPGGRCLLKSLSLAERL